MKQEKLDRAVSSLTSVAAKVYDCVPVLEEYDTSQICGELTRKGMHFSPKMIMGCLNSLKKDSLIKEPSKGVWIQVTASRPVGRPRLVREPVVEDASEAELEEHFDVVSRETSEPRDPLIILMEFTDKMTQLRKEFDAAADEITRYIENMQSQSEEDRDLIELFEKLANRKR